VGKVVMYSSVSVDGFVADENDQPGPLPKLQPETQPIARLGDLPEGANG